MKVSAVHEHVRDEPPHLDLLVRIEDERPLDVGWSLGAHARASWREDDDVVHKYTDLKLFLETSSAMQTQTTIFWSAVLGTCTLQKLYFLWHTSRLFNQWFWASSCHLSARPALLIRHESLEKQWQLSNHYVITQFDSTRCYSYNHTERNCINV